jgi:O-antigen/teichoic acid export membrane protein
MLVIVTLSGRLGRAVLGASWNAAQPLLLPAGVQIVFMGLLTGSRAALLGMRAIRKVVRVDVFGALLLVATSVTGASINGAKGALWAAAAGVGVQTVVWWVVFLRHVRHPVVAAAVAVPAGTPATAS